ncbi:unnamed protein product [Cylicocyclus nassatus]|uniref:Uncharacterized protein n=1 Tax=Cylicocyclus nassatus TaxID=53992 RepID=A0AA36M6I3_CYLNA|nr:unnamed protein product [Cylicocyclus nassatus]
MFRSFLIWLVGTASVITGSSPAPVDVSPECAACQLFAVALKKKAISGNSNNTNINPVAHCMKIPQCKQLTHCEIVISLMRVPTRNITSAIKPQFQKVLSYLHEVADQCEKEPHATILGGAVQGDKPSPTLCTICFLVYNLLQYLNNEIPKLPYVEMIPDALGMTCAIIAGMHEDIPPPVCDALLADGALSALLKAIADSMGSFYDLIAVRGLACPTYQTLFGVC